MSFPKDFVWGCATSSYQIEGAHDSDGKTASTWDKMCRIPGKIKDHSSGDIACDHYHRYQEDVAIMADLGLNAYRFSLSWPRILPHGKPPVNLQGLDFYDRLVDTLLAQNITPFATLFHWDYPYELFCQGGWLNPASSDWFAEYARIVAEKLGDRIEHWMTLNEPQVFVHLGHMTAEHAPALKLSFDQILQIVHNALLAHGKAVQAIRSHAKKPAKIGLAPVGNTKLPLTESAADIAAARQSTFAITSRSIFNHSWFLDPIFLGKYPDDGLHLFGDDTPKIAATDMATIAQKLDFFGFNIYQSDTVAADENGNPCKVKPSAGAARTAIDWWMTPDCLYWALKFFYERYKYPMFITENGLSNPDWVALDGKVHDPQRIDYVARHLLGVRRALQENIPVKGYFHWSLMDNFEWARGYFDRFGMVHVDYNTQKRTIKDSGYWYRELIRSNGAILP